MMLLRPGARHVFFLRTGRELLTCASSPREEKRQIRYLCFFLIPRRLQLLGDKVTKLQSCKPHDVIEAITDSLSGRTVKSTSSSSAVTQFSVKNRARNELPDVKILATMRLNHRYPMKAPSNVLRAFTLIELLVVIAIIAIL